jgi:hypothetical protein
MHDPCLMETLNGLYELSDYEAHLRLRQLTSDSNEGFQVLC